MELYLDKTLLIKAPFSLKRSEIASLIHFSEDGYYLLQNGKRIGKDERKLQGKIDLVCRLCGGKGGFGSMLRAIGAQIEKTTNREACRDLSGRRLRDINEEQRLKNWIASQADREKEATEKKQKKLERMMAEPKHEFRDADYDKLRSSLPEKVEDAVIQGLQASCSTKRKVDDVKGVVKNKKAKLWIDEDLSGSDSISEDDDDDNKNISNKTEVVLK